MKRQEEHQHHINEDEEEQDYKDHYPLGLRVHVAAEERVKSAPFMPTSVWPLRHGQRWPAQPSDKNSSLADYCTVPGAGKGGRREGRRELHTIELFCSCQEKSNGLGIAIIGT